MTIKIMQPVCKHCGGNNVVLDATATWNMDTQTWEMTDPLESGDCEDCEAYLRWNDWEMVEVKPIFEHDCISCTFLGHYLNVNGVNHDLYFCPQGGLPTVIARYGSDGSAYMSGLGLDIPELQEAEKRARKHKLLE